VHCEKIFGGLTGDIDDLIERFAGSDEEVFGHSFQRVRFRPPCAPIEGFRSMGEDVARSAFLTRDFHGKGDVESYRWEAP
jgi:hypothetical protein